MQPTPEQMSDAANTVLFMVGAIVLTVAIVGGWALSKWEQYAAYVEQTQPVRGATQKPRVPDTYQVEPRSEPLRTSGTEPVPNRENDIIYLAQRRADDGSYLYSANKIAEFVGGSRGVTLEAIRVARGQPEPVAADNMQLVKAGPRENYIRTGVKPLR